jgi:WD40 repeat protein
MKWWAMSFAVLIFIAPVAGVGGQCVEVWNFWSDRARHEVHLDSGVVISREILQAPAAYDGLDSFDGRFNAKLVTQQRGDVRNRIILTDRERGISVRLAENASSLAWSPDSLWLAYMQAREDRRPQGLALYNIETGQRVSDSLPENDWETLGIHWSPDGSLIVATFVVDRVFENSDFLLYSVPDLALRQTFKTRLSIASMKWSPQGEMIAGYGTNNEFALMDVASGAFTSLRLNGEGFYQLDWSRQSSYLLVKYSIGELGQWMTILNRRGEIVVESTWITAHEWVKDHQVLVRVGTNSGLDDLTFFDLDSGEKRVIQEHVGLQALSPEGRYVAATDGATPSIRIFDLLGIEPDRAIETPDSFQSLVWREDGRGLIALFEDRSLRELASDEWQVIAQIPGEEWMLRRVRCGGR